MVAEMTLDDTQQVLLEMSRRMLELVWDCLDKVWAVYPDHGPAPKLDSNPGHSGHQLVHLWELQGDANCQWTSLLPAETSALR